MRVIYRLDEANLAADTVLTVGTFDGVHLGHQHLVRGLIQRARETGRLAAALTFHPHPRVVLHPDWRPSYLSSPEERAAILGALGLDLLVILPFSLELANTPPERFIRDLYTRLRMRELWVGEDFALGRQRSGDTTRLHALADELGYTLHIVPPFTDGEEVISSTRIRQLLQEGRVGEVARLLGRFYTISGQVVAGAARGRRLGFRTANLPVDPKRAMPGNGVYAVWTDVEGQRYQAVANVGIRPSFDAGERNVEVHLLDYSGDLYGKTLSVAFVEWLRPEMRFEDVGGLVEQIRQDVARTQDLLRSGGSPGGS